MNYSIFNHFFQLLTICIVQSHQKDTFIESLITTKLRDVLTALRGQYFTNTYPQEILISSKILYLALTTLRNKRTLGEEYVDVVYVDRKNKSTVKLHQRLLFIISYTILPYTLSKISAYFSKRNDSEDDNENTNILRKILRKGTLSNAINLITDLHLILFYFRGSYYQISKRFYGLKYALAHEVDKAEEKFRQSSARSYRILGLVLLFQLMSKGVPHLSRLVKLYKEPIKSEIDRETGNKTSGFEIKGVPEESAMNAIDLSDPKILAFIPDESRKCILCLTPMVNPSCGPCGHLFCWNCIFNWCKERPECPLCRKACHKQSILPIR